MFLALLLLACSEPEPERGHPGDGNGPHADADTDTDADTDADTDTDSDADTDTDSDTDTDTDADVEPPLGGSSGGSGGSDAPTSATLSVGRTSYLLLAPSGSASGRSVPLLVVFSGTEGAAAMMANMRQVAPYYGLDDALIAVLDGPGCDAADGADVLDAVRAAFDVDNDRTWLLSESAGTEDGLELAFHLRPSWFAAYWANDVNARDTPSLTTDELGFVPSGNAGPGGDLPDAEAIVEGMRAAGWSLPRDAPYSGEGAGTHGSSAQFLAAVDFFADKSR